MLRRQWKYLKCVSTGIYEILRFAQNDIESFGRVVGRSLRAHLFFGSDFVKRIIHSAQPLGFAAVEDRTRACLVTRPVDYCMHQGHKICIFSLNAPSIRAMVGGD